MRNFIGRRDYLKNLELVWTENRSRLLAFYGRRRVGKTELIRQFCKDKKAFFFEALEQGDTRTQVRHFLSQLSEMCGESYIRDLNYADWAPVFELLSQKMEFQKDLVIVFDEFPWMASGRSRLVSYVKFFWDKKWKYHPHGLLILCGSLTSWMVKNVVRSTALYGRVSQSILVENLKPFEVEEFIGQRRGKKEILEYLLCFGGIPRYLEEFDFNKSLQLNIEKTCFRPSGFFTQEAEKIFYSQFQETRLYKQIVKVLLEGPLSLQAIADRLKMPSGGGLKQYLKNLSSAGLIENIKQIHDFKASKTGRYYVVDEFLRFHAQFIAPYQEEILHARSPLFERLTQGKWATFLGLAFERFCLRHRYVIADVMEFGSKVLGCGPVLNNDEGGFQYDLVYLRKDGVISVCEVKYLSSPADTQLIRDMEGKISKTKFPRRMTVEKILICNQEPSEALVKSGYFHRILQADEIIQCEAD